ncbi:MAG: hypothetical protein KatS3mg109_0234 [Pirellulaceae bacterium]|nr:MAG: hypothetical protein KatS3mg109_0234 [Pirellulaceae bacterium]
MERQGKRDLTSGTTSHAGRFPGMTAGYRPSSRALGHCYRLTWLSVIVAICILPGTVLAQPMTMPEMGQMAETAEQPTAPVRRLQGSSRQLGYRLASVPKMFGDVGVAPALLIDDREQRVFQTTVPLSLGLGRSKISENNNPLPTNRVFFMYNHFHNALSVTRFDGSTAKSHFDQYTFGIEKLIFNDTASIEVRMPFNSSFDFREDSDFISGGNVGNLSLIYKQLLYWEDTFAIAAGSSFEFPTASDIEGQIFGGTTPLEIQNETVRFLPFVGIVSAPGDEFFWQFTAQVDLGSSGNPVIINQGEQGRFNDQNLLYLDFSLGHWLLKDEEDLLIHSVATLVELHYVHTMQDADRVLIESGLPGAVELFGPVNRFDLLNLAAGLNLIIGPVTNLRIAAVAPLRGADDRLFDSEFQVQLNRWY